MRSLIAHIEVAASGSSRLLAAIAFFALIACSEDVATTDQGHSQMPAFDDSQRPVIVAVGRDGAYGYSQTIGSGFSFSSSRELDEGEMEEGLAELHSDSDVVWLYYSAQASDPTGEEIRFIWTQAPAKRGFFSRQTEAGPVALIEQRDGFVPSGQPVRIKVCVPPSAGEITLQVVAMNRSGARSEPESVVVNAPACASEDHWAQLSEFAELREAASQGDFGSEVAFAYAYIHGNGVFRNERQGTELMRAYAHAGNAEAQAEWASFLDRGKYGIKEDDEESRQWYRVAAEQGHPHAQFAVAWLEQDKQAKLRWYTLAAEQDHGLAQFSLAKMLAEGDGVPRDLVAAKEWMQKSADGGHAGAVTWIENWEAATAFNESGNRTPQLTSVTYTGDERPVSVTYSAEKVTYQDGQWETEGGQSSSDTIVWRKFTVRAEDFDGDFVRYLVTQKSPDTPKARIGGQSDAFQYHASGSEVMFAACFEQISGGEFTFEVIAEDKRGAKSRPRIILLDSVWSDKCQ